jgi:hypothetical protein
MGDYALRERTEIAGAITRAEQNATPFCSKFTLIIL